MSIPAIYPFVSSINNEMTKISGRGAFDPQGVTIHYTADRDKERAYKALAGRNLAYHLVIDRDGKVDQLCYLNQKVDHAGPSLWKGLHCNSHHVAVALVSWGLVTVDKLGNFKSWAQDIVSHVDVVLRPDNVKRQPEYWDAATSEQEKTLFSILRWLCSNGISSENICGHDEAAIPPGRKIDPGGILTNSMEHLREILAMH